MHAIKLLLTYYLNISVQAANLSDCRIESNRKNRFGSENRIESKLFCPNWNALLRSASVRHYGRGKENIGNFVFCRIAPFVMTSGDPESQNFFRFVLLLRVRFAQKSIIRRMIRDRFPPLFLQLVVLPALMIAAKLGCYPSRDDASETNFCHFWTFSTEADAIFVMLSLLRLQSFDLLLSP